MKHLIKKLLREGLLNEKVNKLLLLEELSLLIEKELAVGTTLTNKLENINKEYAKTLLDFLKSNKISDKVTIDSIDYIPGDDRILTGYFKDREGKTKPRQFGVGRLLNYIGIGVDSFKGYELQDLVSNFKTGSLPEGLEFRVFDGDDILWAYHCDNYYDDETMDSCMRHENSQKYLSMYTDNPDSVKCLVLLHKDLGGVKVMGRALLWTMDNGKIYMDRIYTADEHASDYLFFDYAEKNGINESYDRHITPSSSVTLKKASWSEFYPYMDTFMYYNKDNNKLSYSNYNETDNVFKLRNLDGGYTSSVKFKYGNSAGQHIEYDSESDELKDAKLLDYKVDGEHIKGYASIDDVIELYDGETVLEKDARRLISSKYASEKKRGKINKPFYYQRQDIYQYGFKDDVVQLNPDFYEENVHAYFEDVAKVVKQTNGEEFWVLEDDVEDFEDYLYENVKIDSPIKKLLREGLLKEARSIEGNISKDENIGELLTHIYNKYGFDNTYVSFRDTQHVGKINPDNKYNTPTGLYTYKLSNFLDKPTYNLDEFRSKFPFASKREYIQFLVTKDDINVINSNYSKVKLDGYVNQIKNKFGNIDPVNGLCERWLKGEYESYYSKAKHPAHKFWLFIFDTVPYIYPNGEKNNSFAILCRSLGIDGFDDDKCEGWIHPSEKCQSVFFRSNLFKDEFILKPNINYVPNQFKTQYTDGGEIFSQDDKTDNEIIKGISQHQIDPIENFDNLIPYLNKPKIKNYMSNFINNLSVKSIIQLLCENANVELAFDLLPNNGKNFLDIIKRKEFLQLLGDSLYPEKVIKVLGSKGDEFISKLDSFDIMEIFELSLPRLYQKIINILLENEVFVSRVDSDILYELLNRSNVSKRDRIINLINFMSNDNKAELMVDLSSGHGLSTLLDSLSNPDEIINMLLNEEDFISNLKYDSKYGRGGIDYLVMYSSDPEMVMDKLGVKGETEFLSKLNDKAPLLRKDTIKTYLMSTNEPHKLLKSLGEIGEEFIVNLNFDDVRELFRKNDLKGGYGRKIFELLMSNGKFVSNLPSWAISEMLAFGRIAYSDIKGKDRYNDIFNWVKQQFIKYGHGKSEQFWIEHGIR